MNNWRICWFSRIFLKGILIFKGIAPRSLQKSFGVKGLTYAYVLALAMCRLVRLTSHRFFLRMRCCVIFQQFLGCIKLWHCQLLRYFKFSFHKITGLKPLIRCHVNHSVGRTLLELRHKFVVSLNCSVTNITFPAFSIHYITLPSLY
jgi:hypothetical protein